MYLVYQKDAKTKFIFMCSLLYQSLIYYRRIPGVYNVGIYLLSFPIESWQYSVARFSMQVVRRTPIPQMLSHRFQFLRYPFRHLPISLGTRQIFLKLFTRLIALLTSSKIMRSLYYDNFFEFNYLSLSV